MKTILTYILFLLISFNIISANSISFTKVKKLVKKEEEIALAYKKYIREKGTTATLSELITNNYLPKGYSQTNLFGKIIKIKTNHKIENVLPKNVKVKTNIYDFYYSNKKRKYTKAPYSKHNDNVNIILNTKEKYILSNASRITTDKSEAIEKYYLDNRGVLNWYDASGEYKFSLGKNLIVDSSVDMFNSDGSTTTDYDDLMADKDILYAGQTSFYLKDGEAEEYINLGELGGYVKVGLSNREIGKTIVQFTRRAGGMIVNGDIYTWGNNANRITGVNKTKYLDEDNQEGDYNAVLTSLVRVKAKSYNSSLDDKKYFSSPLRPKFVDFFSTVYHNTCGVTIKGELYCNGSTGLRYKFGNNFTHVSKDSGENTELLYRSTYFDGISHKASKIFANNQIWIILGTDGHMYRWGYDFGRGFSGNGSSKFNYSSKNTNKSPEKISVTDNGTAVLFSDITYLLTIGYRKMGALSKSGDLYIWGMESEISDLDCTETWEGKSINLCRPLKVDTPTKILTVKGGLESFIAFGEDGKYYKIDQPKNKLPQVVDLNDFIKTYDDGVGNKYIEEDDNTILSMDASSRLDGSTLKLNEGIVWVNGKNELKGDYFTSSNKNDEFFKSSIKKIKWKRIKVIEDDNGMCGIDIYNQMYCWGIVSFYRTGSSTSSKIGNTYMLPVFNTNLFDLDKDYLVAEGGRYEHLTTMTSGEWVTTDSHGNTGAFFLKYPTYIGGFNYEFEFK